MKLSGKEEASYSFNVSYNCKMTSMTYFIIEKDAYKFYFIWIIYIVILNEDENGDI